MKSATIIKKFLKLGIQESEKIQLDNLDWAKLVKTGKTVEVENEHATKFPVSDLSNAELKLFGLILKDVEPLQKKTLYKTVFTVEVLSEEQLDGGVSIGDILEQTVNGDWSGGGIKIASQKKLVGKAAADATLSQGSDTEFFQMDEYGFELQD